MGIYQNAEPGEPFKETDGANNDEGIQTNEASSEDLNDEPLVTSTGQTANSNEPTLKSTKPTAKSTKPTAKSTKPIANSTKPTANSTKPTANSTEPIVNNMQPPANINDEIIFGARYVESDFTGRLSELESLKRFFQLPNPTSMEAGICVVAGTGGIGKTQLVSKFIADNRASYQNVIWIESENNQSINDSFKALAQQINGNIGTVDTKSVIEEMLNRFSGKDTLFVYDNVETIESINFALVGRSKVEGPHVLITSRVKNWDDRIKVIQLQVWSHNDAVEFVLKNLNNPDKPDKPDSQADIKNLVEELKWVPLALRLATSYIIFQRVDNSQFTICNYLEAIKNQSTNVLKNVPSGEYEKTIFVTLSIAVETIQRNETRGMLATKMLNIIAYLSPNNIQSKFFHHIITCQQNSSQTDETERIKSASRLIKNYAVVTFDKEDTQKHLNIHRSIQEVLKWKLQKADQEELLLEDALQLISDLKDLSTTFPIETIVYHAICVFQSAKIYPCLVTKWSTLPAIILLKFLERYPDDVEAPSSQQLKERIQKIEFLQKQLLNLEEQHSDTVTILSVLALQYLSKEVDGTFWTSWKNAVPMVVTGGVVAIAVGAVGTTVLKQYVERATESAVTKVINKAAQATEVAVAKAIEETNRKWVGYAVTVGTTAVVAVLGSVVGVNLN